MLCNSLPGPRRPHVTPLPLPDALRPDAAFQRASSSQQDWPLAGPRPQPGTAPRPAPVVRPAGLQPCSAPVPLRLARVPRPAPGWPRPVAPVLAQAPCHDGPGRYPAPPRLDRGRQALRILAPAGRGAGPEAPAPPVVLTQARPREPARPSVPAARWAWASTPARRCCSASRRRSSSVIARRRASARCSASSRRRRSCANAPREASACGSPAPAVDGAGGSCRLSRRWRRSGVGSWIEPPSGSSSENRG